MTEQNHTGSNYQNEEMTNQDPAQQRMDDCVDFANPDKDCILYLMQQNKVLQAQLDESQYQQHLYECRWAAENRDKRFLIAQLDEEQRMNRNFKFRAQGEIKELKDQLEKARSQETRSYEEEIHQLRFELAEAHTERISAANRLLLADRIMASMQLKLDEANKKPQQPYCRCRDVREESNLVHKSYADCFEKSDAQTFK